MKLTIKQALQQGVTAHKKGKLQDAERLYRTVLQSQPAHPDANHNLGLIAVSVDKADAALPLFKTALEANPKIEQLAAHIDSRQLQCAFVTALHLWWWWVLPFASPVANICSCCFGMNDGFARTKAPIVR